MLPLVCVSTLRRQMLREPQPLKHCAQVCTAYRRDDCAPSELVLIAGAEMPPGLKILEDACRFWGTVPCAD